MNTFEIAIPILIPLGTAIVLPIIELAGRGIRTLVCLLATALTVASLVRLMPAIAGGETHVYWMSGWVPRDGLAIGISLVVDGWSFLVALIVAVIGFMCLLYSVVYMRHETGRSSYYVLFMLLIAALIGFALSGDLFNQFVWLEVFSVAAFALTGFHYEERASVEAAFKYLVTNSIAALFIAVALSLFYMQTGALNLAHIAREFEPTTAGFVAVGLLIGGYATKAALVPWHFWLPDAHTVAPAPISAMFSGALIKIGIYAIARSIFTLAPALFDSQLQTPLLVIAGLSMFVGGFQMLQQQSIKRILAFSSVSQMGYALMGLAIGTPLALAAAAMHLIHHAMVKSALFMGAGMIVWRTDIHTLREAGGLARKLPYSFGVFCLAGLSLSGFPLFSGFISKTMLEEAALHEHLALMAYIAIAASLLTFAGMLRLIWALFLAPADEPDRPNLREAPFLALLPMIMLVIGSLWVGLFPQWAAETLAWPAAEALIASESYTASVMNPADLGELAGHEIEREPAPRALDWHHWLAPAIVLVGGSLLAYVTLKRHIYSEKVWATPLEEISHILRLWHSGVVNDYALWGAFGTAMLLLVFIVSSRMF
jgi:multicomponent Na+:H+ antiporter subunit D